MIGYPMVTPVHRDSINILPGQSISNPFPDWRIQARIDRFEPIW